MWRSIKEYFNAVVRKWVMIVFAIVNIFGVVSLVSGNTILLPYWAWFILGVIALIVAQFSAYHEVRKQLDEDVNEVESAISELKSEIISVSGQSVSLAGLFWAMGQDFLRGINHNGIFGVIHEAFQKPTGEAGKEVAKAEEKLMYKLRLLKIVRDEQRQQGDKGFIATVTTSLGDSVIKKLAKNWGESPWPPSVKEEVYDKEG